MERSKFIICCLAISILIVLCVIYFTSIKYYKRRDKYVVLTFSDTTMIPKINEPQHGRAGLSHVKEGFLEPLAKIATNMNRHAVYPPPWLCLEVGRHSKRELDTDSTWSEYFSSPALDTGSTVSFDNNGRINTDLSIKYYPSTVSLDDIDDDIDVVVLVNFNNKKTGSTSYDYLTLPLLKKHTRNVAFLGIWAIPEIITTLLTNLQEFRLSDELTGYVDTIVDSMDLKSFIFLHIRRGDTSDNKSYCPPNGTRPFTTPDHVYASLLKISDIPTVVLGYNGGTNSTEDRYVEHLSEKLNDRRLITETDIEKYLPTSIKENNFKLYSIMDELARRSTINISTCKSRLGGTADYTLSKM